MDRAFFIHQFGKVGSQAIEAHLKAEAVDAAVFRDHGLTDGFIEQCRSLSKQGRERQDLIPEDAKSLDSQARAARNAKTAYHSLKDKGAPIEVICGFRDPISFAVSTAFQMLKATIPAYPVMEKAAPDTLADLIAAYCSEVLVKAHNGTQTGVTSFDMVTTIVRRGWYRWWDEELVDFHGVDPRDLNRDEAQQFWYVADGSRRIHIYRHHESDGALPAILTTLLGKSITTLKRENAAIEKPYAALYTAARTRLSIPDGLINDLADLPYVKALYSAPLIKELAENYRGMT